MIIRHILGSFENRMQFCLICGECICDYRRVAVPLNEDGSMPEINGWAEGELFIQGKNPSSYFQNIEEGETYINCNEI